MYEVVEFRRCSGCCGVEDCEEDHETLLFEHKNKPECVYFMKLRAHEKGTKDMIIKDENHISYRFYAGMLVGTINLRVQKV